jgi:dienelactone hydrolase
MRKAALVLLALTGCAQGSYQSVQIPPVPVASSRIAPSALPAALSLPAGTGPFPAVILLHGCGGMGNGAQTAQWRERLVGWGYAALAVDSLAPRGIASVCAPANQPLVTSVDRAADIVAAALFLRAQPTIDPARIAIIGFSHGGGTVMAFARASFQAAYPGLVKAGVNYYGPCRAPEMYGGLPVLALSGEDDDWGPPAKTCRDFSAVATPAGRVEVHTYPGTYHAFDNARLSVRSISEGHTMLYNPSAAADSFARVRDFLDRQLNQPPAR